VTAITLSSVAGSGSAWRRWYGQARRLDYGTTFAAARRGEPGALAELVRLAGHPLQPPIVRATALELPSLCPGAEARPLAEQLLALGPDREIGRQVLAVIEAARPNGG